MFNLGKEMDISSKRYSIPMKTLQYLNRNCWKCNKQCAVLFQTKTNFLQYGFKDHNSNIYEVVIIHKDGTITLPKQIFISRCFELGTLTPQHKPITYSFLAAEQSCVVVQRQIHGKIALNH